MRAPRISATEKPKYSMGPSPPAYLDALVALSGNASFNNARKKLLDKLTNKELDAVIRSCLEDDDSRERWEQVATSLLDIVAKHGVSAENGIEAAVNTERSNKQKCLEINEM
jgi:hypothetical protein